MATIPKVANWPTMEDVCVSLDRQQGTRPLRIRRVAWEVTVDDEQVADRWIHYSGGIWFIEDSLGIRIVAADEFTEDDFFGRDWTSLSVACFENDVSCESVTEFYIEGYYAKEATAEFQPPLSSPNVGPCGDDCALPEQPPSVYVPTPPSTVTPPTTGAPSGGGSGGDGMPSFGIGGGSGWGNNGDLPLPEDKDQSASLEMDDPTDDIDDCLELGEDSCGRKCKDPANPHPYNVTGTSMTLSDPDYPNDLWFVKAYFKGNLVANETMQHGASVDVAIDEDGKLRWGRSVSIRAEGWKSGGGSVSASASVTMAEPCEKDPDCGEPCSGA